MIYPKDVEFYLGSTGYARELARLLDADIDAFLRKVVAYCRLYKIPCVNFEKLLVKLFKDYSRDLDNFFTSAEKQDSDVLLHFGEKIDLLG